MLRSLKDLKGYRIDAVDGEMGSVRDVLFDDQDWGVRYLVVATGPWLFGRRVLVGWRSFGTLDRKHRLFFVPLERDQVKRAPSIDTDAPVSRRYEKELSEYYGWTTHFPPLTPTPGKPSEESLDATHVRSVKEVIGYHVEALDGLVGHVHDLIVEDASWVVRYLVVETRNWLPGKKVLVSPLWAQDVEWRLHTVSVAQTKQEIESGPAYDPATFVDAEDGLFSTTKAAGSGTGL